MLSSLALLSKTPASTKDQEPSISTTLQLHLMLEHPSHWTI